MYGIVIAARTGLSIGGRLHDGVDFAVHVRDTLFERLGRERAVSAVVRLDASPIVVFAGGFERLTGFDFPRQTAEPNASEGSGMDRRLSAEPREFGFPVGPIERSERFIEQSDFMIDRDHVVERSGKEHDLLSDNRDFDPSVFSRHVRHP